MQALTLPASGGWQWLVRGYALFRRQPALIGLLVMSYWMSLILFNVLPIIGPLLASLVMPGLSVGVMTACRQVDRQQLPALGVFFLPLQEHPRPLMALGAIYLVYTLVALAVAGLVDDGALLRAVTAGKPMDPEALEEGNLLLAAQVLLLLMAPILMAYWYAPVLVAWHRLPVPKALFFSFIACLRNWRAFLVYGLGLVAVGAILPGAVLGLLGGLFPGAAGLITSLVTLPLLLVLAPTVFASFYISYRDVFVAREHVSEHV
ncbi:BPSS1780 family membrane protein [Azovibrio restrictus]|uniref:BPSS1780 family membrane protein n=1 Tax=Azovibrio restrictus TaxID=146938 RepID=UPI0026EF1156|nr:BPSS1780 family membrane protein [Azovibrio restrictus]